MRATNWRGRVWAAWLGLLALALNALVPVHLAFDLAEALAPPRPAVEEAGGAERRLLALLSGHREARGHADEHGRQGHRHHHDCAVCSALGALAGLAPPPQVELSVPDAVGLPAALPIAQSTPVGAAAGYRSRAPPIA
jgi:hypothetical protein